MKNLFIGKLNEKDVEHYTTKLGRNFRKKSDKIFKKICNVCTNANIIRMPYDSTLSDEEYYKNLESEYINPNCYSLKDKKNNIIVERYPNLNDDEPYIFVCNHTCPEDIETVINILDRNAYLILGSIESLKYNPEMYLSFLNGMIPFDILNKQERKLVFEKMKDLLKTNSILIFPEGSHNYSPNNLINPLFDGPVNLALQTKRKIVVVTMIKDQDNNIAYVDVGNPIDVTKIPIENLNTGYTEKEYVKSLTAFIRDKMATSVYYMIERHIKGLKRNNYYDIEEDLRTECIIDAFKKLNWEKDVFEAEYLVKIPEREKIHNEIIHTISNLIVNPKAYFGIGDKHWILLNHDIERKCVETRMREHLKEIIVTQNRLSPSKKYKLFSLKIKTLLIESKQKILRRK